MYLFNILLFFSWCFLGIVLSCHTIERYSTIKNSYKKILYIILIGPLSWLTLFLLKVFFPFVVCLTFDKIKKFVDWIFE